MFHSQKVQNGLIWKVIVTFDRHPAIAVAKLNNKHKTELMKHEDDMVYVFFKSSPGNKYYNDTVVINSINYSTVAIQYVTLDHETLRPL